MNMRVEKHVLTILYQSGEARDSSGMRDIKLQGCMTQSSIDKPLPRLHTLWCDPHGGWRHTLDCALRNLPCISLTSFISPDYLKTHFIQP